MSSSLIPIAIVACIIIGCSGASISDSDADASASPKEAERQENIVVEGSHAGSPQVLERITRFQGMLKEMEPQLEKLDDDARAARVVELRRGAIGPGRDPRRRPFDELTGAEASIRAEGTNLDAMSHQERETAVRSVHSVSQQEGDRGVVPDSASSDARAEREAQAQYLKEAEAQKANWPANPTADDYRRLEALKAKILP
jgi:hypothetical protein